MPEVSGVDLGAERREFMKWFTSPEKMFARGTERLGRAVGDAAQFVTGYDGKMPRNAWGVWYPHSGKMGFAGEIKRRMREFKAAVKVRTPVTPGAVPPPLPTSMLQGTKQAIQVMLHENVHAYGEPAEWAVRLKQDLDLASTMGRTMEEGFTELYARLHLDDFIKALGFPQDIEKQLIDTKLEVWAYNTLVTRVDTLTKDLARLAGRGQNELLDRIAKEGQLQPFSDYKAEIVKRAIAEGRLPAWSEESNSYFLAWDFVDAQIRTMLGSLVKPDYSIADAIDKQFAKVKKLGYWS